MNKNILNSFMLMCAVAWIFPLYSGFAADDAPVAKGKNFVIYQKDVKDITEFTENRLNFRTSPEEYLNAAVKLRLYFEESKRRGYCPADETPDAARLFEIRNAYLEKILGEMTFSEEVYESYYYARPELIETPLDDKLKEEIRQLILDAKRRTVDKTEYDRLLKEYDIRICDPAKGDC